MKNHSRYSLPGASLLAGLQLCLLLCVASLFYGCTKAYAQVDTNAPTFLQSAQEYFTANNTNFTFADCKLEVSAGYKQVNGANAASELYGQYNFGGGNNFDAMANLQFSGIGSAVNGAELGFGYALINNHAIKVQADLLAGYDATKASLAKVPQYGAVVVEPRLALKKKLTPNTYAETAFSFPVYSVGRVNTQPSIFVGVGFTY